MGCQESGDRFLKPAHVATMPSGPASTVPPMGWWKTKMSGDDLSDGVPVVVVEGLDEARGGDLVGALEIGEWLDGLRDHRVLL